MKQKFNESWQGAKAKAGTQLSNSNSLSATRSLRENSPSLSHKEQLLEGSSLAGRRVQLDPKDSTRSRPYTRISCKAPPVLLPVKVPVPVATSPSTTTITYRSIYWFPEIPRILMRLAVLCVQIRYS